MASASEIEKTISSVFGGNDEESTVTQFLSTGYPELDHALSSKWDGGVPVGRLIEIYGPESSGKTAIATQIMIAAQQMGGFAGFNDHERSFQQYLGEGQGLDTSGSKFMYKKPKTFEESMTLAIQVAILLREKKLIAPDAPIAWIFDSLASMVPQSAMFDSKTNKEKTAEQRSMHDNTALARATSAHFPAFAQACDDLNMCAVFLNQIRMNIGVVYGNPETTPGGKSPKFYFSQRISLGAKPIKKDSTADADVLGSQITAKIIKNKVARPFRKATYRFDYNEDGTGRFNVHRSMLDFLVAEKILKVSGAYVEWTDGKKYFRGPLSEKLMADPAGLDQLKALLPAKYEPPIVADVDIEEAA
ncbi:hypothetical protein [Phyllobacterium myrsinacearum]|uniref:Protein RecA n=1 Tax=Phyllobacterium myrsinacearum TaxID=28101 RepID=A0A839EUB7_9HYPH|nr:hypothetical protein [Phyllobacterium myrsinacearum]MBA8881778.1 recombination protein RecA [Phyllobacterium myrsinacearum]